MGIGKRVQLRYMLAAVDMTILFIFLPGNVRSVRRVRLAKCLLYFSARRLIGPNVNSLEHNGIVNVTLFSVH